MVVAISEALARDIALTWRSTLQHRVALVTDRAGVDSYIVPSYQWIQLDLQTSEDGASARAALISWFWLSCCEGYSGREHPQFWKRVFSEMLCPPSSSDDCEAVETLSEVSITDAVRFFDVRGSEFPRVQFDYLNVKSDSRGTAFKAFMGLTSEDSSAITQTLLQIFKTLEPHMIPSRAQRAIPVSLHESDYRSFQALPEAPSSTDPMLRMPRFESVAQRAVHASWTPEVGSERMRRAGPTYFQTLFADGAHATSARTFTRVRLERDRLAPNLIQRVCSAGPHARAIDRLHLKTTTHRMRHDTRTSRVISEPFTYPEFSRMDWAWIGYALFHPDATDSSFRHLKIGLHGLTREGIQILKLMKMGNHLHTITGGSLRPTSKLYHVARLREGSIVRRTPSQTGEHVLEVQANLSVCLCVDDVANLPAWVRAAVPGIGLAWIQSSDIVSVTSRPPSSAQLTTLCVNIGSPSETNAALAFARLVGTRLQHLDISACAGMGASKLRLVLEACPALKSLCVQHDGSLWTESDIVNLPQLEELSLRLDGKTFHAPSVPALRSSLRNLTALEILPTEPCFEENKPSVRAFLQRVLHTLQHFHWSEVQVDRRDQGCIRYAHGLDFTQAALSFIPQREVQGRQSHAFASAVQRSDRVPFASLNQDLVTHVLGFADSSAARTYWVSGWPQPSTRTKETTTVH